MLLLKRLRRKLFSRSQQRYTGGNSQQDGLSREERTRESGEILGLSSETRNSEVFQRHASVSNPGDSRQRASILTKSLDRLLSRLQRSQSQTVADQQLPSIPQQTTPPKPTSDASLATKEEMDQLKANIRLILERLEESDANDLAQNPDEECVGCVTTRASVLCYPCGHTVLCRKCFIRNIQVCLTDCNLPVRCAVCRARVVCLRQIPPPKGTKINGQSVLVKSGPQVVCPPNCHFQNYFNSSSYYSKINICCATAANCAAAINDSNAS